jgi:hypothetical protein
LGNAEVPGSAVAFSAVAEEAHQNHDEGKSRDQYHEACQWGGVNEANKRETMPRRRAKPKSPGFLLNVGFAQISEYEDRKRT